MSADLSPEAEGRDPLAEASAFGAPSVQQLTGLLFEIASQLHVERVRRIALEVALQAAGILDESGVQSPERAVVIQTRSQSELDRSIAGLMNVATESSDAKVPLRAQTARTPSRPR